MASGNDGGYGKAILYARVSTDEQVRRGFSLAQQLEALRDFAAREGYEVLEEVEDPAQSGATLERPGMDRVRDLVEGSAGGVAVVLAQDRDRLAREPALLYLLKRELAEHGCKLRAMNDRGGDSPEGELTDGILDQLAKFERAKTAERSRRGKVRKAREGKVVATTHANYGYAYNERRDAYVVREDHMATVRRVFRMVGVEGATFYRVKKTLEREGFSPPKGGRYWLVTTLRQMIRDDVYKPLAPEEIAALVREGLMSPEVASGLDPERRYGIWWYNRRRHVRTRATRPDGSYYWKQGIRERPRSEWVAVPVPDSGIPREHVDAAREAIKDNAPTPEAGYRYWELAGVMVCGVCGRRMSKTRRMKGRGYEGYYHYYYCDTRNEKGRDACPQLKGFRAEPLEAEVWTLVRSLLEEPEKLRIGLDAMVEEARRETRGDPEREARRLLERIATADRKREGYLELAADGFMKRDELRVKLADLDDSKAAAEKELALVRGRAERLEALKRDREEVLASFAGMAPARLDRATPEQRLRLYNTLGLRVTAAADRSLSASGNIIVSPFPSDPELGCGS
jgi:site-specific DNA recombinase